MRIGYGYDSHKFAEGRRLVLGGVEFPGETGLSGHSDADALVHAVIDALLGAAALGDIGTLFPDSDPAWEGADSSKMLESVAKMVRGAGYSIGNVDATVICQRPKIAPVADMMRERLAAAMSVGKGRVSVKGKTAEGMDDVGAGLGVEVHAVCLLEDGGAS